MIIKYNLFISLLLVLLSACSSKLEDNDVNDKLGDYIVLHVGIEGVSENTPLLKSDVQDCSVTETNIQALGQGYFLETIVKTGCFASCK